MSTVLLVAALVAIAATLCVLVERRRTLRRFDIGPVSQSWLVAKRLQDVDQFEPRLWS